MTNQIRPQKGFQTRVLSCPADIAIVGGAAGAGKTFALLMESGRNIDVKGYDGVIFRRTSKQVRAPGGLWDASEKLFNQLGGTPAELRWRFSAGSTISFHHLEHEKNKYDWQGTEIPFIGFDELTHFTEGQFWYLVSRNRSTTGIKPYVRATTNPDASSWVRKLIDWWIGSDGLPIDERGGVLRWFIRVENKLVWGDSAEELTSKYPDSIPKSLTFIPGKLDDNEILNTVDPSYRANLMALPHVERMRLLGGNWNVMPSAGMYFKSHWFKETSELPKMKRVVRCWDRAATEWKDGDPGDPDWTVGLKLGEGIDGKYYIIDIVRERYSYGKVEELIKTVAQRDGREVTVKGFQDPGQAGKGEAERFITQLAGFHVTVEKINTNKETAAKPLSSQCEHGNVLLYSLCANKDDFYFEMENFPKASHDDIVDAASGAFNYLTQDAAGTFTPPKEGRRISTISSINKKTEAW